MADTTDTLMIDMPEPDVLELTCCGRRARIPIHGHVDNLLLTAIDKLLQENSIDKSVLKAVQLGQGIDKNSSFGRIVLSLAAAIRA
jgi:hypothetical protein